MIDSLNHLNKWKDKIKQLTELRDYMRDRSNCANPYEIAELDKPALITAELTVSSVNPVKRFSTIDTSIYRLDAEDIDYFISKMSSHSFQRKQEYEEEQLRLKDKYKDVLDE